jgi:hypothetical protein
MKRIFNLLLLFVFLGLFITSCTAGSTPTQEPDTKLDVILQVRGTTAEANVSYTCFNDPPLAGDFIELPWELELSCEVQPGEGIRIFAIPRENPGTLTCEIYVNGELVASDSLGQNETQRVKCEYIP